MKDLGTQCQAMRHEVMPAVGDVMRQSAVIHGLFVAAFEQEMAAITHSRQCVGSAHGTEAIFVALEALGVKPGDERLDGLQAAILSVKLGHLANWMASRRRIAGCNDRRLADVPGLTLVRPRVPRGTSLAREGPQGSEGQDGVVLIPAR